MGKGLRELQEELHQTAVNSGWWDNPEQNIPEKLMLVCCEVAEAMEEYRKGKMETYYEGTKPEGFGVELADAVIRILDLCGYLKIDIESIVEEKAAYNKTRPYRHGNKKA